MKMQPRVSLILITLWAILFVLIFGYSRIILIADYSQLEKTRVTSDIHRTEETLQALLAPLKSLTNDWSQWDDAYAFMTDKNDKFIQTNMQDTTFANAKINFILFFKLDGTFLYGRYYDLAQEQFDTPPAALVKLLETNDKIIKTKTNSSTTLGLLNTPTGILAISSLPVLPSSGKGELRGTVTMGFYLTPDHIAKLSEITKVNTQLYPLPISAENNKLIDTYNELLNSTEPFVHVASPTIVDGYTLLRDINQTPVALIEISSPRSLYQQGVDTINRYVFIVLTLAIIFLIATWLILKREVLNRVSHIGNQLIDINNQNKFKNRITVSGQDELNKMVHAINALLTIIELTEDNLKARINIGNEEIQRVSTLNKDLFVTMDRQKKREDALRKDEQELRKLAYYDVLTELPNRVLFNEILIKMLARAKRDNTGIAILFIDIDKFKSINDTYGHMIGDKYLEHVGHHLKQSTKESDIAARLAGDEFLVCLNNINSKVEIIQTVKRILDSVSQPMTLNDQVIESSFSVGISMYPDHGDTIEELEKKADIAMYQAKKVDENSYAFYEPSQEKSLSQHP